MTKGVPASPSGSRASHEAASSTASSPEASIPNATHWGDGSTPCNVEDGFGWACQQEADERADEAELYHEAEQDEIRCALALFRSLSRDFGQYRAVKVDGPRNWTITKPRTDEALLAALETTEPPAPFEAAQPIIDRLNRWEKFWTNRYRWSPPDGKRIEVRVGDLRQLRAASADTRPKGGDGTKIAAPSVTSGAVGAAETPSPSPSPAAGR